MSTGLGTDLLLVHTAKDSQTPQFRTIEVDGTIQVASNRTTTSDSNTQFPLCGISITSSGSLEDSVATLSLNVDSSAARVDRSAQSSYFSFPDYWVHSAVPTISLFKTPLRNNTPSWSVSFETTRTIHMAPHMLSRSDGTLIMAGSTLSDDTSKGTAGTVQGFFVMVDATSGEIFKGEQSDNLDSPLQRYTDSDNEWVTGICQDHNPRSKYFYVVGTTNKHTPATVTSANTGNADSDGQMQAFVKKVDMNTQEVFWEVYWGTHHSDADTVSQAIGVNCAAASDTLLYVTGTVSNGASIVEENRIAHNSNGGDDVWLAQIDTRSGTIIKTEQFGSAGDERLAAKNSLVLDHLGEPIVYGDTTATLVPESPVNGAKSADNTREIFVIFFDHEKGIHRIISNADASFGSATNDFANLSDDEKEIIEILNGHPYRFVAIGGLAILALGLLVLLRRYCILRRESRTSYKPSIYDYMRPFDQNDIKMTLTRTGGWCVTFPTDCVSSHFSDVLQDDSSFGSHDIYEDEPKMHSQGSTNCLPRESSRTIGSSVYDYLRPFERKDVNMTLTRTGGWTVTLSTDGDSSHYSDSPHDGSSFANHGNYHDEPRIRTLARTRKSKSNGRIEAEFSDLLVGIPDDEMLPLELDVERNRMQGYPSFMHEEETIIFS